MSTYIDHHRSHIVWIKTPDGLRWKYEAQLVHSWTEHTARNLAWRYGAKRARAIQRGNDPVTQADLAAWSRLGRRSAA